MSHVEIDWETILSLLPKEAEEGYHRLKTYFDRIEIDVEEGLISFYNGQYRVAILKTAKGDYKTIITGVHGKLNINEDSATAELWRRINAQKRPNIY